MMPRRFRELQESTSNMATVLEFTGILFVLTTRV